MSNLLGKKNPRLQFPEGQNLAFDSDVRLPFIVANQPAYQIIGLRIHPYFIPSIISIISIGYIYVNRSTIHVYRIPDRLNPSFFEQLVKGLLESGQIKECPLP